MISIRLKLREDITISDALSYSLLHFGLMRYLNEKEKENLMTKSHCPNGDTINEVEVVHDREQC